MTSSFLNVVIVNVVGTGIVVTADDTMVVSRVVIGSVTIGIVVPSENDPVLLKDTVVFSSCKVEKDTLVGKGCNGCLKSCLRRLYGRSAFLLPTDRGIQTDST
jgi:hypothetical protein